MTDLQKEFKKYVKEEFDCDVVEVPRDEADTFEKLFKAEDKEDMRREFNRRFANGEQYLKMNDTEIYTENKAYFWQERNVYNLISIALSEIRLMYPFLTEEHLDNLFYAKDGIVETLIPIQRAYNALMNRKQEFLARYSQGVLLVEDGSVDLDNLQDEGLSPGKVLVYRQGSTPPTLLPQSFEPYEVLSKECDRVRKEFEYMRLVIERGIK